MSKFSIRALDKVAATRIKLFKLAINKVCPIDEFEKAIIREGGLSHDVSKIYMILEKVCNLRMLPKTMFRLIQADGLPFQLYEAKSKNLRFYLLKLEKTGKVILIGGRKSTQKADLKYLMKLVKDIHFEGITNIGNL